MSGPSDIDSGGSAPDTTVIAAVLSPSTGAAETSQASGNGVESSHPQGLRAIREELHRLEKALCAGHEPISTASTPPGPFRRRRHGEDQ
jgi:hypothetical protein